MKAGFAGRTRRLSGARPHEATVLRQGGGPGRSPHAPSGACLAARAQGSPHPGGCSAPGPPCRPGEATARSGSSLPGAAPGAMSPAASLSPPSPQPQEGDVSTARGDPRALGTGSAWRKEPEACGEASPPSLHIKPGASQTWPPARARAPPGLSLPQRRGAHGAPHRDVGNRSDRGHRGGRGTRLGLVPGPLPVDWTLDGAGRRGHSHGAGSAGFQRAQGWGSGRSGRHGHRTL